MTLTANRCFWGCFLMLKGFDKVDARLYVGIGNSALSGHLCELCQGIIIEGYSKLTELILVNSGLLLVRIRREAEILLIWHLLEWIIVSHRIFLHYLVQCLVSLRERQAESPQLARARACCPLSKKEKRGRPLSLANHFGRILCTLGFRRGRWRLTSRCFRQVRSQCPVASLLRRRFLAVVGTYFVFVEFDCTQAIDLLGMGRYCSFLFPPLVLAYISRRMPQLFRNEKPS